MGERCEEEDMIMTIFAAVAVSLLQQMER